ncbi:hypothetical protein [Paenibacillus sp. DMB5]|uniref:hypothetical protein n=1 Tax=Paenibacillus sp. DMB5 TaxID=1780103 RepID=UPI000B066BC9|nr:hypothetical protein [Paenibacillus sp. DMB5]
MNNIKSVEVHEGNNVQSGLKAKLVEYMSKKGGGGGICFGLFYEPVNPKLEKLIKK